MGGLLRPDAFLWATGIEDTFVFDAHPSTGRILDEYALTDHYRRWQSDLALAKELGVPAIRYGIPWYRVNPEPGRWEWTFADASLGRLLDLGIEPIVDLVHYGTPAWLERGFLNPLYPEFVADYATRVARRYEGRIKWYTPLNEPRVTAWYCGRLGWWPPYRRGDRGFVEVLVSLCEGIVNTHRALIDVDPEIVVCHVDATDLYSAVDLRDAHLADWKQQIVFLPLDLVTGRVDREHRCYSWLLKNGVTESRLTTLRENAVLPDIVGLNLYPMFTNKVAVRGVSGKPRFRMHRGKPRLLSDLGRLYGDRYGLPMMVTETASDGDVDQREAWLRGSVDEVRKLREEGYPLIGYTWWPMFALVAWAYRQTLGKPIDSYLVQMGLWDLDSELNRIRTPLVDRYREFVETGASAVGSLAPKRGEVELVS